jgi:hypothetical protein
VFDNCGVELFPSTPAIGGTYAGCEGTVTYTFTYTDCEGNANDWVYTYTIEYEDFAALMPADDGTTVDCYSDVTEPTPPQVFDNCGVELFPSTPAIGGTYAGCEGTVTYTFTYTDCEGNANDWVYTWNISDDEPPTMSCPDGFTVICETSIPDPYASYSAFVLAGGSAQDNCGVDESSFAWVSDVPSGSMIIRIVVLGGPSVVIEERNGALSLLIRGSIHATFVVHCFHHWYKRVVGHITTGVSLWM